MTEKKKQNTKNLAILGGVIILIVIGLVLTSNKNLLGGKKNLSPVEAKTKAEAFIKDYLLRADTKFTVGDAKEYNSGLYEIEIKLEDSEQPIKSYMTKDGNLFIPQAMDINEVTKDSNPDANANADNKDQTPAKEAPKSDKPKVEIFVMSHCPYGTQIEKGIIPVVEALGAKIDFQLKFVDYAMHGKKELDEEMSQYCINKEQGAKLLPYLKCFLKAGESAVCLKETGIDQKKVSACVAGIDKQYKISEVFGQGESAWGSSYPPFPIYKDDNTKYGVQGSPTLVINGEQVSAGRDSASLAKIICGAFSDGKKPAECDKTFDSASPAPGFGTGTTTGSTAAGCAE